METYYELALVVELFHQQELFLKVHSCRRAHGGTSFGAERKFLRHKATGIEDEVCTLKEFPSAHTDEVWVARSGTHNLDMALATPFVVLAQRPSEVDRFVGFRKDSSVGCGKVCLVSCGNTVFLFLYNESTVMASR